MHDWLLNLAGIADQVELEVQAGQISIRPAHQTRSGWAVQFATMAAAGNDQLLDDEPPATTWNAEEWEW